MIRGAAATLLLLLAACGARTDVSYEERLDEWRDEFGPFSRCDPMLTSNCETSQAGIQCLGTAISLCRPFEHESSGEDTETVTTFVTPSDDGRCEIIVFRDFGRGSAGVDYQRERCEAVEVSTDSSCLEFRRCEVERRWRER